MKVVVPLAGPEYFKFKLPKGLNLGRSGKPQLLEILKSRIWSNHSNLQYIFILKDSFSSRNFANEYLSIWFPNSNFIFLSKYSQGAALSSLSAISFHEFAEDSPIIFDLADIYFETKIFPDFDLKFKEYSFLGYTFKSSLDIYSYYKLEGDKIIYAEEKKVISNNASAGVYVYKSSSIFLKAISKVLSKPTDYLYKEILYLSPIVNGLIESNEYATVIEVENHFDYKLN